MADNPFLHSIGELKLTIVAISDLKPAHPAHGDTSKEARIFVTLAPRGEKLRLRTTGI